MAPNLTVVTLDAEIVNNRSLRTRHPQHGLRKFLSEGFYTLRATCAHLGEPLPSRHPWGPPAVVRFMVAFENPDLKMTALLRQAE